MNSKRMGSQQLQQHKHIQQQLQQLQEQQQHLQEQQQQRMINPSTNSSGDLVKRCQQKFEKLEETCMERYVAREQRVISTLNFCMTALEQLRSWAVFAIFPLDEQHSDKYITFVEQRYSCVVGPLRIFVQAIQREQNHQPIIAPQHNHMSPRMGSPRDYTSSPRDSLSRNSPRESLSGSSMSSASFGYDQGNSLNHSLGSSSQGLQGPLRDRINHISHKYLQEGVSIKDLVVQRLVKCRKEMRIIYRWGQASLMDLHDVFDESLSDELYYMVRGKMARVLSAISVFEEAADQIERNLSNQLAQQGPGQDDDQYQEEQFVPHPPPRSMSAMDMRSVDMNQMQSQHRSMSSAGGEIASDYDLRVDLQPLTSDNEHDADDMLMASAGSLMTSNGSGNMRFVGERSDAEIEIFDGDEGSTRSGSGSTPEPPGSPRPRYLGNHPKIMKDKLQSLALPSKFPVSPRMASTW